MNKFALSLVSTAAVTISIALSTVAHAKKPRVCEAWYAYNNATAPAGAEGAPKTVYVCVDGKKPRLMVDPKFVEVRTADGLGTARLAIEAP
jgi:hypothetical protein